MDTLDRFIGNGGFWTDDLASETAFNRWVIPLTHEMLLSIVACAARGSTADGGRWIILGQGPSLPLLRLRGCMRSGKRSLSEASAISDMQRSLSFMAVLEDFHAPLNQLT